MKLYIFSPAETELRSYENTIPLNIQIFVGFYICLLSNKNTICFEYDMNSLVFLDCRIYENFTPEAITEKNFGGGGEECGVQHFLNIVTGHLP